MTGYSPQWSAQNIQIIDVYQNQDIKWSELGEQSLGLDRRRAELDGQPWIRLQQGSLYPRSQTQRLLLSYSTHSPSHHLSSDS